MKKIITKKGTSAPVAARAYSDLLGGVSQLLESARRASARAVRARVLGQPELHTGRKGPAEEHRSKDAHHARYWRPARRDGQVSGAMPHAGESKAH